MDVKKETSAAGVGVPDAGQLEKINALAKGTLTAEQVYVFSVKLCDDQVDRDFERFDTAALPELAKMFVGKSGIVDHRWSAEGQLARIFDTEILEQLIAKTGLPPFLLGLSWATTERMSAQQADLLTSELWAIRRCVEPVIRKICRTWLVLEGFDPAVEIRWDEISLQDMAETARAELYRAQAEKLKVES